jgi:hypothetical protein
MVCQPEAAAKEARRNVRRSEHENKAKREPQDSDQRGIMQVTIKISE